MAKRNKAVSADGVLAVETAKPRLMIPSGITLLDLACTDTTAGFCEAGHCVNSIGDRNAGKTMQAVASMAETFHRYGNAFDYKLLDAENAYCFDTAGLFGTKFAKALEVIPVPLDIEWCTQNLAAKMIGWMKNKPQYFVIDSMDQLRTKTEYENDEKGEVGGALALRAVANKYLLRRITGRIASTNSFMVYLSQAAEGFKPGMAFVPKTRGGGKALGFYAFVELWLSKGGQIKVGDRTIGDWTIAKTARSKGNGKVCEVWFPIYPAYGIDDCRANLEWLYDEGVIKPTAVKSDKKVYDTVDAKKDDKDADGKKKKTMHEYDLSKIGIEYIGKEGPLFVEEHGLVGKVVEAVKAQWDANEQDLINKTFGGRKSRYE